MNNDKLIEVPSNWGGARENAGRLPIADVKMQVTIGIKKSVIKKLGGKAKVQEIMRKAVDKSAQNVHS